MLQDPSVLQSRDLAVHQEVSGDVVRPVSVEHNDVAISFNSDSCIFILPNPIASVSRKMDDAIRQKKLMKSPGVREKCLNRPAAIFTAYQKPVRPGEIAGSQGSVKEDQWIAHGYPLF